MVAKFGRWDNPDFDADSVELCRAVGCDECGDTGYKGRTGIHELLVGTHELQAMIYKKAELDDIRAQALKDGMRTMKQGRYSQDLPGSDRLPATAACGV